MTPTAQDVRSCIADFFSEPGSSRTPPPGGVLPDDFDVVVDGGLDSLGFLELLTRIETDFDRELDLSDAADGDMTRVGTLVRAVTAAGDQQA